MLPRVPWLMLLLLCGCFQEFAWEDRVPDPASERLCAEAASPDTAANPVFPHCRVEGSHLADPDAPLQTEAVVMAWNIERGFEADAQLEAILADPAVPMPDVLLLSEVDRGCRRTDFRNIARDYAEALGFNAVFATEFVELPGDRGATGPYDPPLCEHGNAILSRWPIGNVRAIRHRSQHVWYTPPGFPNPDEPRLGGRVALAADITVEGGLLRVYSLHLESTVSAVAARVDQALEIVEDARHVARPVVVGGDFNTFEYFFNVILGQSIATFAPYLADGFQDAHTGLPVSERITTHDPGDQIIDVIFTRGVRVLSRGVCPFAVCGDLSDHVPVWATVEIPRCESPDLDCDGAPDATDVCPLLFDPDQADADGNGRGDACPWWPPTN
ncbi:MAG: endonuclease/exonuclease/phosphatase family protein [Deltaproteobacteria bacterium]|nr:endonuclease/exonuclease/phosphatase family protein [Deltaproteobacteria bacterium]MBW2446618.1 endonuclease/exonuclease/phosphatase family protein [Deltaproteobacteria bacterium]